MMNILNKITIKSRMILAFVLVVFIFVLFGVFSIKEMDKLGNLTRILYEHPLRVSNAALTARLSLLRMHRGMKDVALSDTELELENAYHTVLREENQVYKNLDIVKKFILGREGKELEREARKIFSEWKPIRDEVVSLVMQGQREVAAVMTKHKSAEHVNLLENRMHDLSSYARNKADGFMKDAETIQAQTLRSTILFITLTALISFVIAWLLISSIIPSISALKNKMSDITTTGSMSKAELNGNNEITDMSRYFNGLIDMLKGQLWLKEGQNELNHELSGGRTYEDLVNKSIQFVSRYVDACTGALYYYNAERSLCELKATFAYVERKYLANAFRLGEGIVGQAAIEKNPILLKNIGREEAVGQTGTVCEPPKNIYALPMVYEGDLYGVLEVASFENLEGMKREFLDSAGQTISTHLYTVSQREKINELLESTREANEKLQTQAEELQSMNVELQHQADVLQDRNVELETQRRRVEEANRLKSEFLSNMSHELRTPLNSVNALSRILLIQTRNKLSEEETNYLEIIERNGKHLLSLINNILDLSKIEAGKMDVTPARFSLKNLLETIMEGLEPVALEKGIDMVSKVPDDMPWIESDESRVHQVLQNIVGNSVKFTEKGGVTVSASFDQNRVYIRVKDTGIGIPEDDLPYIFEEFRQVDGSLARRFEGTGLGLAIAFKAAVMLGGDITVESAIGRGSTFTVILPLKFDSAGSEVIPPQASPAQPTDRPKPQTILVVDDDPRVAALISENISQQGYRTVIASSGREALHLAEIHKPFAITLDVVMPEMDGWEVLQGLKKNPITADIPVIIVSMTDDRETGFALGAVGYLTKPVNKRELISEIIKTYGPGPRSIMIVDDNDFDRKEMSRIIHEAGVHTVLVEDGKKCLEKLGESLPDALVLDLMMPGMDGFEVLEKIRLDPRTKNLPVIVVTAKDLSGNEKRRLEAGASAVLSKGSCNSSNLIEEIKTSVNNLKRKTNPSVERPLVGKNRILLVEDNDVAVVQVKTTLEAEGYKVDVARNGKEAIDYVRKTIPDGIILDLMIPDINGFGVLERIRSSDETRNIPVLILTAKDLTRDDLKKLSANNIQQLVQKGGVDRENLVNETKRMLGEEPKHETEKPTIVKRRKVQTPPVILAIEDNLDNLTTIKAVLRGKYDLMEAVDGETGLRKAVRDRPDLILLDMSLPGMDGFAVIRELKRNEETRPIPVIALTAHAMKGQREKILEAGCDDYLAKPVDTDELLEKIDKCFQGEEWEET